MEEDEINDEEVNLNDCVAMQIVGVNGGEEETCAPAIGTVIFCPLQKKIPTPIVEPTCDYETITVDAPDRDYTLIVNKLTKEEDLVLEIVAGYQIKSRKITIKITGMKGPCSRHKNAVIDFTRPCLTKTDSCLEFNAVSIKYDILEHGLKPSSPKREVYWIPINTCSHKRTIKIVVYPDIGYNFSVTLTPKKIYSKPLVKLRDEAKKNEPFSLSEISDILFRTREQVLDKLQSKSGMEFKAVLGYSQDSLSSTLTFDWSSLPFLGTLLNAAENVSESVDFCSKVFKPGVSIEYKYLCLTLVCKACQWGEHPQKPTCGLGYNLEIGFKPLFGIDFSFDIAGAILLATYPFLAQLRDFLETKKILLLKLAVTLGGSIDFSVAVSNTSNNNMQFNGTITLKFEASIEGGRKNQGDWWQFSVGAGASFNAESSLGLGSTLVQNSAFRIKANFSGVVVKANCYAVANIGQLTVRPFDGSREWKWIEPLSWDIY